MKTESKQAARIVFYTVLVGVVAFVVWLRNDLDHLAESPVTGIHTIEYKGGERRVKWKDEFDEMHGLDTYNSAGALIESFDRHGWTFQQKTGDTYIFQPRRGAHRPWPASF